MFQLENDNPIVSKLQKVKSSFKTDYKKHRESESSPYISTVSKKLSIDHSSVTPFTCRNSNVSISPNKDVLSDK